MTLLVRSIGTGLSPHLARQFLVAAVRRAVFLYSDWFDGLLPDDPRSLGELKISRAARIRLFATYGQNYVEEGFGFAPG